MKIGNFKQEAHPILSIFVLASCIVIVGLLYVTQKAQATADALNSKSNFEAYL
jgi:hypothetical protein